MADENEELKDKPKDESDDMDMRNLKEFPPADFMQLVLILVTQIQGAMGMLGEITGQKTEPNLPMSKYFIDLLVILRDKTKGNLSPEEEKTLNEIISGIQVHFIRLSS